MADTVTTNYGWVKPNVNDPAGVDLWGGKLNADLDGIDSTVFANATTVANVKAAMSGGFVNKLRNGTFDVWQRGTSLTPSYNGAYTADGWQVLFTGNAPGINQGGQIGYSLYSMNLAGVAGNTDVQVAAKIESSIVAPATPLSESVTFQIRVWNNTGATITPKLTVQTPVARDSFTTYNNVLSGVSLQPCPNYAVTVVAYTFAATAGMTNGIVFVLDVGAMPPTSGIALGDADFRATPGLPVGLCANPPPPELRPIHEETLFCQRYYIGNVQFVLGGSSQSGIPEYYPVIFPVEMRAAPAMNYAGTGGTGYLSVNVAGASTFGFSVVVTPSATSFGVNYTWNASAEL